MNESRGKTLVVTNDFPPRRGGIESFVFAVCEELPPDGLVVYTARMAGSDSIDSAVAYPVIRDRARMLLPTVRVGRRVRRVAREHGCDRVVFGAAAPLGLLARGLRAHTGVVHIKALTHGHEVWWAKVPVASRLLRRIGDDTDVLTYVSEFCRQEISGALSPAAAARMQRLSPAVDTTRFRRGLDSSIWRAHLGIDRDRPVVLSASRLVRRKGQDTLVKAWPWVLDAQPDALLVIVGDGPSKRRLQRMVRRRHLRETVIFHPGVAWDRMPEVYAMADAFALPCRTRRAGLEPEAFGIVFAEAGSCGLPLIVGDSGGAPEAAREFDSRLVDPDDVAQLARQICSTLAPRRRLLTGKGPRPRDGTGAARRFA